MSNDSYEEVRQALKAFLTDVLKDVIMYCEHQEKKVATLSEVSLSLKRRGKVVYGFRGDAVVARKDEQDKRT